MDTSGNGGKWNGNGPQGWEFEAGTTGNIMHMCIATARRTGLSGVWGSADELIAQVGRAVGAVAEQPAIVNIGDETCPHYNNTGELGEDSFNYDVYEPLHREHLSPPLSNRRHYVALRKLMRAA